MDTSSPLSSKASVIPNSLASKLSLLDINVRPRVLATCDAIEEEVDRLVLAGLDEMTRRELGIRAAAARGDFERAQALKDKRSRRHRAYISGDMEEFDLLSSLRPDNTVDLEEAGDRETSVFLQEKDGWYERNRRKMVERIKKQQQQK